MTVFVPERGDSVTFLRNHVERSLSCAIVGSPETVRAGLQNFIDDTGADELMITAQIYDHAARLRSFEIVAEAREALTPKVPTLEF